MSKTLLTDDELDALNALCDLAHKPGRAPDGKLLKWKEGQGGPPLRLQNLASPMRARSVRMLLDMARGKPYRRALADNDMSAIEFAAIRHKDQGFALVWEVVKRLRDVETADLAADGLRRLCTEDGCGLNVKAITFALERLNRKTYGRDESGAAGGGGSGPKNVYNIVIQGFPQGQPCGNLATNPTSTPVIDA